MRRSISPSAANSGGRSFERGAKADRMVPRSCRRFGSVVRLGRAPDTTTGYHWNWAGEIYYSLGRYEEAVRCFAKAAPMLTGAGDFAPLLNDRLAEVRALQMTGRSLATRDLCRAMIARARAALKEEPEKLWIAEQTRFTTLSATLLWRDAVADLPVLEERARQPGLTEVQRKSAAALAQSFTERVKMREAQVPDDRAAWAKAAEEHGPHDERTLAALRTWTASCGNAGGVPALDDALAELDKFAAANNALLKAEAVCEAAWYRALFRDLPAAETLRLMRESAACAPDGSSPPGAMRILGRVSSFSRYAGLTREAAPLVDETEDRMSGQTWPAAETTVLVPRFHRWLQGSAVSDPGEAWRSAAEFREAGWGWRESPLGNANRYAPASLLETISPFDSHLPALARTTFTEDDPAKVAALKLRLRCADGAIVWLNGKVALRRRVPADVTFRGQATGEASAPEPDLPVISNPDPALLRPGVNVLAVAVYFTDKRTGPSGALLDCALEARRK